MVNVQKRTDHSIVNFFYSNCFYSNSLYSNCGNHWLFLSVPDMFLNGYRDRYQTVTIALPKHDIIIFNLFNLKVILK